MIGWRQITRAIVGVGCFICSCTPPYPRQAGTFPVSHQAFTELLQQYVDDEGRVDYEGLAEEREKLDAYQELLTSNAPNDANWSRNAQLAYWINLYNAYTLSLVLDHYPLASIKDISTLVSIPFVNSPWDIRFISIQGSVYDLNDIEHNILRQHWDEPRIHFAINCASLSCPRLMPWAFEGALLDSQLDECARHFINDGFRNVISPREARLSRIFRWYQQDFTTSMPLTAYINQYSAVPIEEDAELKYLEYDWSLNAQD